MKRATFSNIQASHVCGCENYTTARMRTGYEKILPHRTSDKFAKAADEDGTIVDIDNKLEIMKIRYKSGREESISFADYEGEVSGLNIHHNLVLNVKLGEKVKEGDILVYNSGFFKPDPQSKQVNHTHGFTAYTAVMEVDDTHQDSSAISKDIAEKLVIQPTELRTVKVTSSTDIIDIVKVGTEININDKLCIIEDEAISALAGSEELALLAEELNVKQPKAEYAGTISKIDVFYAANIDDMTPSLAKVVRSINLAKNKRRKYASDTGQADEHPMPTQVPVGTKFKDVTFEEDTVLLLFYITESIGMDSGSKIIFGNQLKSTVSTIFDPEDIVAESGKQIDAVFGSSSINARIISSIFTTSRVEASLDDAEQHILDIWDS